MYDILTILQAPALSDVASLLGSPTDVITLIGQQLGMENLQVSTGTASALIKGLGAIAASTLKAL